MACATVADANGNRLTASDGTLTITATGGTDRAVCGWTHNRAGQVLTEASTITGDASNGTVTYTYDPLARLTGSTLAGQSTLRPSTRRMSASNRQIWVPASSSGAMAHGRPSR